MILSRAGRFVVSTSSRRAFVSASPALRQQAAASDANKDAKPIGPDNYEIAPTVIPWREYKNKYYEDRGFPLASKDHVEWTGLPAPFNSLGVKVNPDHVTQHGAVWKFMSDWKTAVPTAMLLSMPLWMFNVLPAVDERMELAFITVAAGWVAIQQAGPMFRSWKRARVAHKVKSLLAHEKELNDTIDSAITTFEAGSALPECIKLINEGERALRAVEAEASSRKILVAQRDALVEQLDYLVQVQSSGAADAELTVVRTAREAVEASLEKDAALQQSSISAAIRALKDGATAAADDVVAPLFADKLRQARAELAAKPASKPMLNAHQIDLFKKRFGYIESAVSQDTLDRASKDAASLAVLTGRVGGKAPAVGLPYVTKAPILFTK